MMNLSDEACRLIGSVQTVYLVTTLNKNALLFESYNPSNQSQYLLYFSPRYTLYLLASTLSDLFSILSAISLNHKLHEPFELDQTDTRSL
ncbi:hypothetical protein [Phaffia rhodozyma]|uniref:Uncharacterized protein n=1 Tax=Phaffia rhodozyma TaxID=264483 RepID=A0A0F7SPM1_PHARH|nr:hypothetical protein [Phaffia rhodozyma]